MAEEDRIIGVFSGKGGVGKTISAVNLGLAMQELGRDAVCIDGDIESPNIALQLGLDPGKTVLNDSESALENSIYIHGSGLMFVPSAHILHERSLDPGEVGNLADRLNGTVLVDAPPGFSRVTRSLMEQVTEAVVVAEPERPALRDAGKTVSLLEDRGAEIDGVILNRAEDEEPVERFEQPLIARVPPHPAVRESIRRSEPLLDYRPYSRPSLAYRKAAAYLADETYEPPSFPRLRDAVQRIGW
ncbi:MAG: P-loop NTPase [Candidatus Nanohaloarchaea archaeon]|nr:P-loop NTPase [Candidatus Nanohaloarchaea archaeon]